MAAAWMVAFLCSVLIACFLALIYFRFNSLERRMQRVATKLSGKENKGQASKSLSQIYGFITDGIVKENDIIIYKAAELLKTAYSEGLLRSDEPVRLMGLVVKTIHAGRYNAASVILNAFRPMILYLPPQYFSMVTEQLILIAVIAFRARQYFFVSRITDYVFFILENKTLMKANSAHVFDVLRVLKVLGLLALRRKDASLFREICICWNGRLTDHEGNEVTQAVLQVWTAWLHRIVQTEKLEMFDLLTEGVWILFERNRMCCHDIKYLLVEWHKHAGIACLNPHNPLTVGILRFMLQLAEVRADLAIWVLTIRCVTQVIKTAISQRNFKEAFSVFIPLLEMGRKLFILEIKFGEHSDGFRQQVLFQILKECLMLVAYVTRQDYTVSQGECIQLIRKWWIGLPECAGRKKTILKFCQFLFIYWMETYRKQARKDEAVSRFLLEPQLLTEREKELFFFFKP